MAALRDVSDVETPSWRVEALNLATKSGKIVRRVTERYLRDDLSCSLPRCHVCCAEADTLTAVNVLMRAKTVLAESPRNGVYLLPSMKTVLLRMDLLEFSTKTADTAGQEVFADVLVLETVWEFVKRQDLRVYGRLKALILDRVRRFVPFANEHHRACFVEKKVKLPRGYENDGEVETQRESGEERNERAVAATWRWYTQHLEELQRDDVKVLFLAHDAEDLEHAEKCGVEGGVTIAEFLEPVAAEFPELQELLSITTAGEEGLEAEGVSSSAGRCGKQQLYPEHLQAEEIATGIESKKLFKGAIRYEHRLVCRVLIHGSNGVKIPVVVEGWSHMNRAIDGDVVAIQMLPKDQWKKTSDLRDDSGNVPALGETGDEEERLAQDAGECDVTMTVRPTGRVVGIIQRNWRKCCGSLELSSHHGTALNASGRCLVVPVDWKMPKIKIQTRQQEALRGKRLPVEIDSWPVDSKYPLGHYVRTLGGIGDEITETDVLLIEHNIARNEFSDEVVRCLPPEDWEITPQNSEGRRDLRRLHVFSIDPPNCSNIDDALHVRFPVNGNYEVGVHIADVTHFVAPGTALDRVAAARGKSSYLVNRRCDMLPDLLTTKFCSLTANEDHFAFSVLWELKITEDDVQIAKVEFCKSIIRSVASLTYSEAQDHLRPSTVVSAAENRAESNQQRCERLQQQHLVDSVKMLSMIAAKLRKKRNEAGGVFDSEADARHRGDQSIVEEFMLLAEVSVAKKIHQHFPLCSTLRRHPTPPSSELAPLVRDARGAGVELRVESTKELKESIDFVRKLVQAEGRTNRSLSKLLCRMTKCCRKSASYFRSGDLSPEQCYHFKLAAPVFTHFTSPTDVMVHRLLAAAIGVGPIPSCLENEFQARELCEHLNKRCSASQRAGRASNNLFTVLHFQQCPTRADAEIIKVKSDSIRVELLRFGIEGTVFFCNTDDHERSELQFDPVEQTLTVSNRNLQLFDHVRVKVYADQTFGKGPGLKMDLLDEHDEVKDTRNRSWRKAEKNLLALLKDSK